MAWEGAKAIPARLALADSAVAEMVFCLALSPVPLVGVAVALVSRWLPVDLSAPVEKFLRDVLPAAAHVAPGRVMGRPLASPSQRWLTVGFVVALWTSFRFVSHCRRPLGTMAPADVGRSVVTRQYGSSSGPVSAATELHG